MIIAKVIGTVIATRKSPDLVGSKFLIIEPLEGLHSKERMVAVDTIGAGVGEIVLVATGSAARLGCSKSNAPIDAAVVGIVDDLKDICIS